MIATDISKRDALKRVRQSDDQPYDEFDDDGIEDQPGVVLGLHNVAVSAPQIVATLIASIIFHMTQRERGVAGDDSVGWVLRFGGLAGLLAAWRTLMIPEGGEPP